MDFSFLSQINYFAVAASSIVYFLIGSFWFSSLFGLTWAKELEKHNVIIKEPTSSELTIKMVITFISNILAALGLAYLVAVTNSNSLCSGLTLGLITSIAFAAGTLATVFTWESRSLKLFLIDIGYPVVGILTSAVILSLWK